MTAHQQSSLLARTDRFGNSFHRGVVCRLRCWRCHGRAGHTALTPGHIGRQYQCGDLPGRCAGSGNGFGGILAEGFRALGGAHKPRGHVAGYGLDIRLQLGIVFHVVGGVVAHNVQHRHLALAGVVQVGQAVAQPAAQMQQGGGGLVGHARVAVGGAGGDSLEQGKHRPHLGLVVQGRHKVHFTGAGVAEANLNTGVHQGFHQGLSAVCHCCSPSFPGSGFRLNVLPTGFSLRPQ